MYLTYYSKIFYEIYKTQQLDILYEKKKSKMLLNLQKSLVNSFAFKNYSRNYFVFKNNTQRRRL